MPSHRWRFVPAGFLLPFVAVVGAGCAENNGDVQPTLRTLPGCPAVLDYVREVQIARMNREIDRAYAQYVENGGCYYGGGGGEDDAGGVPDPSPAPTEPDGPTHGTGTNNQVDGVDEADFVKNDGQYLYIAQNGVLRIIDSWPANQTHAVSVVKLPGTPRKMLLAGDRLVVYTAIGDSYGRECTYGYTCQFGGDGTTTKMLEYDVSDRSAPHLLRTIDLSGSLIAGRLIGSTVHTVVSQDAASTPSYRTFPDALCNGSVAAPAWEASIRFEQLRDENRAIINDAYLDLTKLPSISDSAHNLGAVQSQCNSYYGSAIADGAAFTSVMSFDMSQPAGPLETATIVSQPGAVYASTDALYIAVAHQVPYGGDPNVERSAIHRFGIGNSPYTTAYQASGFIRGHVLGQFAMDERDGKLRIASTSGMVPSPDVESQLTILSRVGDRLDTIGAVRHIAPHEDIRAVRFDGDRGFVVTFKKTDPLFVFDLADPHAPRMLGELMIPGFSTYIHMLDATHLLTIGYDADDHGDFAYFDGVMLQIFDVTDPTHPTKLHDHIIGTRGSSSEALTNHLAFTWYPDENMLAIPMTICEGGDDGTYGSTLTFSGLMVFDTSIGNGFSEHGRVPATIADSVSCSNWWSEASSVVKRSIFLDNYVYAISGSQLIVRDTNALASPLVDLPL